MQEIHRSNAPGVTGICDPNKSHAWHHWNFSKKNISSNYL